MKLFQVKLAQYDSDAEVGFEIEEVTANSENEAREFVSDTNAGRICNVKEIPIEEMDFDQLVKVRNAGLFDLCCTLNKITGLAYK